MNTSPPIPFGVRHLVAPESAEEGPVMTYNEALQLNVSAQGNPWHAVAALAPETQTETSGGDGSGPETGSDNGTDMY